MPELTKASFYCIHCGFQIHGVTTWWIKSVGAVTCAACGRQDGWKKVPLSYLGKAPEIPENDLWKKLIVAQNPNMFRDGRFKLATQWKKYLEWLEFEVKPSNPELYQSLIKYVKRPIRSVETIENAG